MPISYAVTPEEVEEERRLLYVGMTRTRRHLSVSWALARTPGGRASRKPSRFLDALLPESAGEARSPRGRRHRGAVHCRECGKPLNTVTEKKVGRCADCPASYDEELFERLRAWRLARATEESVPAFVIFTDATLQLLAEVRPANETEMLRVNGIGKAKLERYSGEILALLRGETERSGAGE
jgi:DNA helicase-2/ATP-dependent DNA helicase PcrA